MLDHPRLAVAIIAMLTMSAVTPPARAGGTASAQPGPARLRIQNELDWIATLSMSRMETLATAAALRRLINGYRTFGPLDSGDYALNRELARRSLAWLRHSTVWHLHDPVLARAYFDAYDAIGRFHYADSRFYTPGAYVAYAGGARLARRLWLLGAHDWANAELNRFALAYGALAIGDGRLIGAWAAPQDLSTVVGEAPLQKVPLPELKVDELTADQRAAWQDLRVRFRSTSQRVHQTRVRLVELSATLRQRGLALHAENAATAMKMQGFLEDAADLIEEKDFATATHALRQAEYEQARLIRVTGQ